MSSAWIRTSLKEDSGWRVGVDRRAVAWAVLGILAVWFLTLDYRHLLRSDEGRYAEIAREMFASGDWVTIRYNALKYFEKPPFHLWVTAIAYELFGVGDWQARLWVALSAVIATGFSMLAALRWYGTRVALLTGLVLVATPSWNMAGHFNSLDMGVSAAMAVALACLLIAQHPDASHASRRDWMLASWAAMAIAVLTKGLIGIALPGLVLIVYTLVTRQWTLWARLHIVKGLVLFLVISAPWFIVVSMRNPEFAQFFFVHEHFQRYTTNVHQRGAPSWYFVPQLLAGFAPWLGLTYGSWRALTHEKRDEAPKTFRPLAMLATWAIVIFVFFSASHSKLPGYIVPVYPALAVMAAVALDKLGRAAWTRQLNWMFVIAAVGLVVSLVVALRSPGSLARAELTHYAVWLAVACAVALAGLWLARRSQRGAADEPPFRSMGIAALTIFVATTIGLLGHETLGRSASGADLVPAIDKVLKPDMPIYSVRMLDHTLPFYLRRTTIMVETPDELEFGTQQEPSKWVPTLDAFINLWKSGPRALALMSPDTYRTLETRGLPMTVVAQDARRVVVTNAGPAAP